MTDEEQQLHELLVDLVSNTHRFAKLAGSFASDQYPRAWLRALSLLEEYGEMRISDFARLDRSSQPSATALLRKLGENGYVERRADPEDARAVRVAMTDKGRKILNDGRNEIADALVPPTSSNSARADQETGRRIGRIAFHHQDFRSQLKHPPLKKEVAVSNTTATSTHQNEAPPSLLKQPKAVWAVAFASVIAFMGIGLVDPILKPIGEQLDATPSQVSLLFTSYMLVTGVAMLITGVVSSRIGAKKTLLAGLAIIIVFASLAGASSTIGQIVGFRAGWGLGNALFIATALAAIVGAASGGVARAIILYEAALGIGIAVGPLVGGVLGDISWRAPFFGVAA